MHSFLFPILIVIVAAFFVLIFYFLRRLKELYKKAYIDDVTGLYNRVYFHDEVQKILEKNPNQKYALMATNIVHFRTIYGSYGPELGNVILKFFAEKAVSIRNDVLVARAKEDKYQILLPYETKQEIIDYIEKLSQLVHTFSSETVPTKLYIRCGVGLMDGQTDVSFFRMLSYVELARKEAINRACTYYFFDTEMGERLRREKEFSDIMESALQNGEFKVYYQAKHDIVENTVIGAEALVRWDSSVKGFMKPDEFIPVFERNGFVIDLDFYVLEEVCKMLRSQLDCGKRAVPVSVNQSRMHFLHDDYCERMRQVLLKYSLPPGLIELEITETAYMNMSGSKEKLIELKNMGYQLSIDDFGNGYSSFPLLFNVPIDTLKIDKDFLFSAGNRTTREILLKMIVEMSKEMNLSIICEGVEKEEQVDFLLSNGCKNVQGYLYARPVPESDYLDGNYLKF